MKRILAFVLAAAMMLTLSVGALADDEGIDTQASEVPIRVEGMAPGQEVGGLIVHYYVNMSTHSTTLSYVSDYKITSIHIGNSIVNYWDNDGEHEIDLEKNILKSEFDDNEIIIEMTLPNPYDDMYSDSFHIKSTMTISLENGKEYVFPLSVGCAFGVDKGIFMKVTDETGIDASTYRDEYGNRRYPLPAGKSMKFTVEVLDDAKISQPPYHIQITTEDYSDLDKYKISEVTMLENGTKGQFTITHIGDSSYSAQMYIVISLWDDSTDGNTDTTYTTRIHIDTKKESNSPNDPDKPNKPSNPSKDPDKTPTAPEATNNTANDEKTITAVASGEDTEVKLSNGSAGISADTINALGGHGDRLTIVNGGMSVNFPGGFNKVTEPGRIYFPFDYEETPQYALEMLSAVKGTGVKSEARKVGGAMILPGSANVTLKTKLTGTVNIYLYDKDTGGYTAIATTTAKDGTVTFPTNQMGYMVLTTGRI